VDEPTNPDLIRVKSRVTAETWQKRVAQAKADEAMIQGILKRVAAGASLNAAIMKEAGRCRRTADLDHVGEAKALDPMPLRG
jgi:hypothetical protein